MQAQIKSWGNSQGIRIPKEILQEANFNINDYIDVKVQNGMIMLCKPVRHKTLEERAAKYGGKLELSGEFDKGEPVGREIW
ncbi:MAG: AbrB/MazE/SpoVT family DNA-binding domain-containing protein [Lachnospiraceae bacterium]|nr:AbrB/MazE/SpoVT family DNA-binding domain-containing protein [Lachnospiraceae bacterium]